ncbi:MAG: TerB family tellurite resistance protein [Myxococcota bacterium]|jgi:uncharacterized tellurite resistance protein B-like protein|nr:TerB family tellurite resistance protein [Myxococcota bacterium]
MPNLLRFIGLGRNTGPSASEQADEALHPIVEALEGLKPERARFFAAFAYVLARVAGADLRMEAEETESMVATLAELTEVSQDEARLVVQIASARMDDLEATHNYLVTREFGKLSDTAEKIQLLECLYAVAAADGTITGDESNEVASIAEEIGLSRSDAVALRSRFRDKLAEFRKLEGERTSAKD